ncbi:transporter, UIT6 family [Faunimonas pinastri]|uniref:Transporter, UIT6 family n=1 Tax=Faunimonas pinastri TaxID=1855383 RepID=A0A1H9AL87_9HYPH|nr:sodium:proton antiporter [Faunimonas pinastri]SEP77335.1 transporter, UIT6 family [Faunimonas pinastri]
MISRTTLRAGLVGTGVLGPVLAAPAPAFAASAEGGINGAGLDLLWIIPFAGLLLSIALMPLVAARIWHHHFGKIAAGWAVLFVVPAILSFGAGTTADALLHALIGEYIPFIVLLFALFTVAGGIYIKGNLHGAPALNTGILLLGTACAGIMGTTGAAMLFVRPLIRANDDRRHSAHVMVFFIFLVANIGGSLTPLGDPPLFLGFLQGVSFFWPTTHLLGPMALVSLILLVFFFAIDRFLYIREGRTRPDPTPDSRIRIHGLANVPLLIAIALIVLGTGIYKSPIVFHIGTVELAFQDLLRDVLLIGIALLSLVLTPKATREANGFEWGPIAEVAKLFAGIFITIIPALAILKAGQEGALSGLLDLLTNARGEPSNAMYFWLTGILSSFLDNAPTYLVFFNAAGGDAQHLMGPLVKTLEAISIGAVFMGANTYIGNAPNFMVKAIAESNGIRMPSFFAYMLWSVVILVPCFVLITLIYFLG